VYVLLYFLRGKLPWQGLHVKNKEDRYHRIMEIKMETTPNNLCKGFPKEFEEYVDYTRNLEYEQDPDYDFLKNLFYSILKEDKNNSENIYDWDIGNKTLNTITTSNTSQKAFLLKDKEKEKQRQRDKKENRNNNFIDIQNIFNKNINEFEECFNKPKNDRIVGNKFWSNTKNTNERFYHSQIIQHSDTKKNINTEGNTNNKGKNILKKEENNINDEDIIDLEYQNIMELTEEGKDNDINKCPNVSGLIHSKNQIEKNNSRKLKDKSECIIF
jgi:casein kinase I family protein HRR25